jgi:hypothetical protein
VVAVADGGDNMNTCVGPTVERLCVWRCSVIISREVRCNYISLFKNYCSDGPY